MLNIVKGVKKKHSDISSYKVTFLSSVCPSSAKLRDVLQVCWVVWKQFSNVLQELFDQNIVFEMYKIVSPVLNPDAEVAVLNSSLADFLVVAREWPNCSTVSIENSTPHFVVSLLNFNPGQYRLKKLFRSWIEDLICEHLPSVELVLSENEKVYSTVQKEVVDFSFTAKQVEV